MDFAQARMHNYNLGRFTSPDDFSNDTRPSDPSSWNLYVYARNNPLYFVDPSGKEIYVRVSYNVTDDDGNEVTKYKYVQYIYEDGQGQFKDFDTSNNEQAAKVLKQLNELVAKGDVTSNRIKRMLTDGLEHQIRLHGRNTLTPDQQGHTEPLPKDDDPMRKGRKVHGSITYYNPNDGEIVDGNEGNPLATLARELGVAFNISVFGNTSNESPRFGNRPTNAFTESDRVWLENDNHARDSFGLSRRTAFPGKGVIPNMLQCKGFFNKFTNDLGAKEECR